MIKKFLLFKATIKKDKTLLLELGVILLFIATLIVITIGYLNTKDETLAEGGIVILLATIYITGEYFTELVQSMLYLLKEDISNENYFIYDRDDISETMKTYMERKYSKHERK